MNISPEEAQIALEDIRSATTTARSVLNNYAYFLVVWGVVWTLGFLACQFFAQWISWILIVMLVLGMIGSSLVGITQGGRVRMVPGSRMAFVNTRLGMFYGVLYSFSVLWLFLFPRTLLQVGMLWITLVMFGAIVEGIWLQQPVSIGLGIGVTVLSVIGYYLLPHYFWLWVAVFAGLPLIAMGISALRKK
jgi:hypothetical protein